MRITMIAAALVALMAAPPAAAKSFLHTCVDAKKSARVRQSVNQNANPLMAKVQNGQYILLVDSLLVG